MNKFFTRIVSVALGLTLAIGVGVAVSGGRDAAMAEATDASFTFNSATLPSGWSGSTPAGAETTGDKRGTQYTSTFTIDTISSYQNISSVTIVCSTNAASNKLKVQTGDTTPYSAFGSEVTLTKGDKHVTKTFNLANSATASGKVHVTGTRAASSIWIESITIVYSAATLSTINLASSAQGTSALTEATVKTDKTLQVYLTGNYSNDTHVDVTSSATWESGNESIATVSNGLITGVSAGSTTISASYGGKSAVSLDLTVEQGPSLVLNPSDYVDALTNQELEKAITGTTNHFSGTPTFTVESADDDVVYASMNGEEANKVDLLTGEVTSDTNVNVTVTASYGLNESVSKTVAVRVKAPSVTVDTDSIVLNSDDDPVDVNITAVAGFENGYTVEAQSSNTDSFTVSTAQNGSKVTVTPVASGSGNLTITVKNSNIRSKDIVIPVSIKMFKSTSKYFVISSNNEILLAKGKGGETSISGISNASKVFSTVTFSSNGLYVKSIESITANDLSVYGWTITDDEGSYIFKNASDKYLNIYSKGQFYIDGTSEEFTISEINSTGYYTLKSNETNTYLNISEGAFTTNSSTGTTGYKFVEYKAFGTLDSISVSSTKTEYYVGETFDTSTISVVAADTNGVEKDINIGDCTVTGYDLSSAGDQTVTVTYSGKTATFDIEVLTDSIDHIEVTTSSNTFYVGDTIEKANITLKEVYESGKKVTIDPNEYSFDSYEFKYTDAPSGGSTMDAKSLFVAYDEQNIEFSVNVGRTAYEAATPVQKTYNSFPTTGTDKIATSYTENQNVTLNQMSFNISGYVYSSKLSLSSSKTSAPGHIYNTVAYSNAIKTITVSGASPDIQISKDGTNWVDYTSQVAGASNYYFFKLYYKNTTQSNYVNISSFTITLKGAETARTLADFVMYEDTTNQCTTKYSTAESIFIGLSSSEKESFMTGESHVISKARERLIAWAAHEGKTIELDNGDYVIKGANYVTTLSSQNLVANSTVILIVLVSTISVAAVAGYFLIRRRRED